jgi:hypothetical protein
MSIRAGSIVLVGGRNIIDRLQTAGLTGQVPIETIREIGNDLVVDKVPGEPDYTFTAESWDVTADIMAFLQGRVGNPTVGEPPGYLDAAGTEYRWENCRFVNVTSPWKDDTGSQGGHIGAGLILPGYYPTRMTLRYGVAENATESVDLAGGAFYYGQAPPVEEYAVGDGTIVAFVTAESARAFRIGGAGGATFRRVFGVLLNGVLQVPGVDYVESVPGGTLTGASALTTITFTTPPAVSAQIRLTYFTETAKAWPQALNADSLVKPGAVRGRDIEVYVGTRGTDQVLLHGMQSFELTASIDTAADREMGQADPVGRSINGTDATGTATMRPTDRSHFFDALSRVTGVAPGEVFGFFNTHKVPVEVKIKDPANRANTLKTIYVADGQFQPPGLPARVNTATDFPFQFDSASGSFSMFKGDRP